MWPVENLPKRGFINPLMNEARGGCFWHCTDLTQGLWTQHFQNATIRVRLPNTWPLIWSGVSFGWPGSDDTGSVLASVLLADFSKRPFGQSEAPNW